MLLLLVIVIMVMMTTILWMGLILSIRRVDVICRNRDTSNLMQLQL
jgi:hypothetical protein